jgi:hypothetical protein
LNEVLEPRSFGGGLLEGENVAKFVHMDEAGISHGEPYCVQVGVIVDADEQWKALERRLIVLTGELVPKEFWPGWVFHAHKVFHGSDPAFSRERMPNPADRADVVRQFAALTIEFALPIAVGWVQRSLLAPHFLDRPKRLVAEDIHGMAFLDCLSDVDEWLRDFTKRDVGVLIVENNNESKRMLQRVHDILSMPVEARRVLKEFPMLERIVEQPNFVEKRPLSLLQIADACAFSAARCLRRAPFWEILYEGIRHGVTSWPADWEERSSE